MKKTTKTDFDDFSKILTENNFWIKKSAEGSNNLMRAISNCIYFTESQHQNLQKFAGQYFNENQTNNFKFLKKNAQSGFLKRYYFNPDSPEFETISLELLSFALDCQFKIYFSVNDRFCCELYNKKKPKTYRLFRTNSNTFHAIFKNSIQEISIMSQNIILNLVDRLFNKSGKITKPINKGKFVNFDFETSKKKSENLQPKVNLIDSAINPLRRLLHTEIPYLSLSQITKKNEISSIGDNLLEIFKKRKSKSVNKEQLDNINFLENFISPLIFLNPSENANNSFAKSVDIESTIYQYEATFLTETALLNEPVLIEDLSYLFKQEFRDLREDIQDFTKLGKIFLGQNKSVDHLHNAQNDSNYKTMRSEQNFYDTNNLTEQEPIKKKLKTKLKVSKEFVPTLKSNMEKSNENKSLKISISENKSEINSVSDHSLSQTKERYLETIDPILYEGRLKFFDEKNGFGFMLLEENGLLVDLFVYKSEFKIARVPMDMLRQVKNGLILNFTFQIAKYTAKSQDSRKAINITLVKEKKMNVL